LCAFAFVSSGEKLEISKEMEHLLKGTDAKMKGEVPVKNLYSENYVSVQSFPRSSKMCFCGLKPLPRKRRVQGLGLSTSRKVQFLTMLVTRKEKFEKEKKHFQRAVG